MHTHTHVHTCTHMYAHAHTHVRTHFFKNFKNLYFENMTKKLDNFNDFIDYYGSDTTNNFQLIKYAKELKIPNFYCLMNDELNNIPKNKYPINIIINLHSSNKNG